MQKTKINIETDNLIIEATVFYYVESSKGDRTTPGYSERIIYDIDIEYAHQMDIYGEWKDSIYTNEHLEELISDKFYNS